LAEVLAQEPKRDHAAPISLLNHGQKVKDDAIEEVGLFQVDRMAA